MPTPTSAPVRKVAAGGIAGAFVTLIVGILNAYVPFFASKPISGEIAGAATTVLTFLVAYSVRPDPNETTMLDQGGAVRSATQ